MADKTAGGRTLTRTRSPSGSPSVDVEPYDPAYFAAALKHIAGEFGIPMPEIEEAPPEERGGSAADFVLEGQLAFAFMNGRRCCIAASREETRDRIYDLLLRLPV